MSTLTITKKQESALYILRLEGLRRKIELEEATQEYETAKRIEKEVDQYVVDNNEYFTDCPDMPDQHNKKVVKEFDMCFVNEDVFINDYVPKVKEAFMILHGIDNPLNFVYSYPMHERKMKAEKAYQMIAVEFLKICGRTAEAETIQKSINTYMKKDFVDRLYKMNDDFIGGK